MIRFFMGNLMTIPFSYVLGLINKPINRLAYCIATGLFVQTFVFGQGIFDGLCVLKGAVTQHNKIVYVILSLMHILTAYCIMRNMSRTPALAWTVLIFTLVCTGIGHVYRYYTNYGGWDMSICQLMMMQCIHLSVLAWDYVDGAVVETPKAPVSKVALKTLPNLIEYLAAALVPNQMLGGPNGHVKDFLDYIYHRNEYQKPVPTVKPAMIRLGTGLCWLVVYIGIVLVFPTNLVYGETYAENGFLTRVYFFEPKCGSKRKKRIDTIFPYYWTIS